MCSFLMEKSISEILCPSPASSAARARRLAVQVLLVPCTELDKSSSLTFSDLLPEKDLVGLAGIRNPVEDATVVVGRDLPPMCRRDGIRTGAGDVAPRPCLLSSRRRDWDLPSSEKVCLMFLMRSLFLGDASAEVVEESRMRSLNLPILDTAFCSFALRPISLGQADADAWTEMAAKPSRTFLCIIFTKDG